MRHTKVSKKHPGSWFKYIPGSDWDRATFSNAPDPFLLCCSADLPDLLRLVTSRLWLTAADAEKGDPEADPPPIPLPPTGFLFPAGSNETYLKTGLDQNSFKDSNLLGT